MMRTRLAAYYGAWFLMGGIHLPFWQLWLDNRGLSAEQIGIVLSSAFVIKVFAAPYAGQLSDRLGERKRLIVALGLLSILSFALFYWTRSFLSILLVNALFLTFLSPSMPLMESLTMQSGARHGLDYGRIRLWGSVTFILGSVGVGYLLEDADPDLIYWAVLAALGLTGLAAIGLPDFRLPKMEKKHTPVRDLLRERPFVVFMIGGALIQSSHAVYYSFGTLYWRDSGIDTDVIGWLWAEGVIVEIVLFVFGASVVSKIGPARLIALAGLAGLIRWTGTALTADLWVLAVLQALHGATFGAAHLGAMHFIQSRVRPEHSASAQSLYSGVVMSIGMGLAIFFSGKLYARFDGHAYLMMAAMAGTGGALLYAVRRR